jgi:hypothetical protein
VIVDSGDLERRHILAKLQTGKPTNVVAFLNQQMHSQLEQEVKR